MKPSNLRLRPSRILVFAALLFGFALAHPLASQAHPSVCPEVKVPVDSLVSVQYIGTRDDLFVFRVQVENNGAERYSVLLKNDEGVIVYREDSRGIRFDKNFCLPNDEGSIHPTFVIRVGNKETAYQFSANRTITEKVDVVKQ
jgi:hypothetical protein